MKDVRSELVLIAFSILCCSPHKHIALAGVLLLLSVLIARYMEDEE